MDEFYRLTARTNLNKTEVQIVSRFLGELKESIKDAFSLHIIWTLTDAINLA